VRDGLTKYYDENGVKFAEEMWVAGARHGRYQQWSLDGELECEGQFSEGERHGTWQVYKVARSSMSLGCPPVQDSKSPVASEPFSNRRAPGPATLGDEEHEYAKGRCTRSTEPRTGPNGMAEIDVTEWDDRGYPTHRVRWSKDRSAKLEDETYEDYWQSKNLKGWYPSGERYFEARRVNRRGLWHSSDMRYWNEQGQLIHDFTIADYRIETDKGRPIDEVFAIRLGDGCGVSPSTPMPAHDNLWDRVLVLAQAQPLDDVVRKLSHAHEIPIVLDTEAFQLSGVAVTAPITIQTRALPLHSALHLALEPYGLTYVHLFSQLFITTWDRIPNGGKRSPYNPCGPPEDWKNPTGLERYDEERRIERFERLRVRKPLTLENASLETVAKTFSDACEIPITVDRNKFSARDLRRTVSLHARHEDAFDLFGSALFQLRARAVERNGRIVILPAEPLKRRPRPPEPA
jgi:hypothetical protein